jgi:V/A-type H+-transporting ATPase subunit G/H
MSLDAIKQVTQAETETKQRKADAAAAAKKLVADAEDAGKQTVRDARAKAEAEVKQQMAQAEARAAERAAGIVKQGKQECDALRNTAQGRLEQAADLIVRRVVSS